MKMLSAWLLLCLSLAPFPVPAELLSGTVVGITDGDTLRVLAHDMTYRIRLAEIDTPEKGQPYGKAARQALAGKVFRQTVTVDIQERDRYGRLVGRVWLDGRDINREMVAEGHAWVYRRYLRDRTLLDDETTAREAARGLWALQADQVMPPWAWREAQRARRRPDGKQPEPPTATFSCGAKRYCREMASCAEARFHLQTCGLQRLDGDGDGVPCETICR